MILMYSNAHTYGRWTFTLAKLRGAWLRGEETLLVSGNYHSLVVPNGEYN